jgi:hypothetical protein
MTSLLLAVGLFALIVPSLIVVLTAERLSTFGQSQNVTRNKVLFLLLTTIVLLLLFLVNAVSFSDGRFQLPALILLPTLVGLLALSIIRWREFLIVWEKNRVLISGLLLVTIVLIISLGTAPVTNIVPIVIPILALLTALSWVAIQQASFRIVEVGGILIAGYLFIEAVGITSNPTFTSVSWLNTSLSFARALGVLLALILIAALIHRIQHDSSTDNKPFASTATGIIILLLLALASVEVRDGVLAKATGRAAEDLAPLIEIMLAILTGMILIGVSLKHKRFTAVVYTILLPILLLGAYSVGWLLEPQVITQSRADHLVQAVERFQSENGFYPDNLNALTPHYIPYILGPLTGRGQVWCYQSGIDFYRLGYAYYQRYYGPTFPTGYSEVRIHAAVGEPPAGQWMCDEELAKNLTRFGL